jgi:hypothetical protein
MPGRGGATVRSRRCQCRSFPALRFRAALARLSAGRGLLFVLANAKATPLNHGETPAAMMMEGLRKSRCLFRFLRYEMAAYNLGKGAAHYHCPSCLHPLCVINVSYTFFRFSEIFPAVASSQ